MATFVGGRRRVSNQPSRHEDPAPRRDPAGRPGAADREPGRAAGGPRDSEGFIVTQATLSRDIRELGLAKLADPQGGAYYTHPHRAAVRPDLAQVLPALLVSVDGVGPLLVLKTASGSAGAITEALDQAGWAEVIGTIAGDDTVLVITRSQRLRESIARRIRPGQE